MKTIILSCFLLVIHCNIGHASILSDIGGNVSNVISQVQNKTSSAVESITNATSTTLDNVKSTLTSFLTNSSLISSDLANLLENHSMEDFLNASSTTFEKLKSAINSTLQKFNKTSILESYQPNIPEDGKLDFIGLADKYVGGAEPYYVVTDDGYILGVFHIPGNTSKVALLSHGILSSGDDFLDRGNISLVYTLVQNDFDVWVMNYRGNRYSRNHTTMDPDTDTQFWKFSMHEMGYYDLAAVIDFVLDKTGQSQLSLIGHSEGTSAPFVLTSTRPEYNDKINYFAAMAPVAFLQDTGITLKTLIHLGPLITNLLEAFDVNEVAGFYSTTKKLIDAVCTIETVGYDLCFKGLLSSIVGYGPDNTDEEFFHIGIGHYPAGTSVQNFVHYIQVSLSNQFRMFDHGATVNQELYGTEVPPSYNLGNITCPVGLYVADNDKIAGLRDAERIQSDLGNVVNYYRIGYKPFTHQDYIWGSNSREVLYPNLTDTLNAIYD